jgi:kynureninase
MTRLQDLLRNNKARIVAALAATLIAVTAPNSVQKVLDQAYRQQRGDIVSVSQAEKFDHAADQAILQFRKAAASLRGDRVGS